MAYEGPIVPAVRGGTDNNLFSVGDLLYANSTTTLTKLNIGGAATLLHGGVTPSYSAVSLTADVSGILPSASGGTGINNGSSTINLSGNLITSGAFSATLTFTNTTNVTFPTSGTLATTSGTVSSVSGTANRITISGTSTAPIVDISASYVGQSTITTLGTITTGAWNASLIPLAYGGSNANLTANTGGILYSSASAMAILSGTATANKMLLSGATAAPTWSTSTIPTSAGATANKVLLSDGTNYVLSTPTFPNASATAGKIIISDGTNWIASTPTYPSLYLANNLLYAIGANAVAGLATANNGVLITSGAGVPSISSTIPSATQLNITQLGTINTGVWQGTVIDGTYINYNTTNLKVTAAQLNTSQNIAASASPSFVGITINGTTNLFGNVNIDQNGATPAGGAAVAIGGSIPDVGTDIYGIYANPTFAISNNLFSATNIFLIPIFGVASGKTVSDFTTLRFNSGQNTGSGSVTTAYQIQVDEPNFGTTKLAAWFKSRIDIGTTGQASFSRLGVLNAPQIGIVTSSPGGFLDVQGSTSVNGAVYGTLIRSNMTETGASSGTSALYVGGTHTINGSGTNTVNWLQVAVTAVATTAISSIIGYQGYGPSISGSAATTSCYAMSVSGAAAVGSGGLTYSYTAAFFKPTVGTNKTTVYADDISIGYSNITPPTLGMCVSGNVGIGTSSPDSGLHINQASGSGINPKLFITQQGGGGSNTVGLSLYEVNGSGDLYFDSLYDVSSANIYFRGRAAGTPINLMILKTDGSITFNSFSANGSVVTALTGVGPTGSHTAVQEWFTIKNNSGTVRYIPCF